MSIKSESFSFGENWSRYAANVDVDQVKMAERELLRLLPELGTWSANEPPTFVDVGCGSGVHSVAAARLGARVVAFDVDAECVSTTKRVRDRFGLQDQVEVFNGSIFDVSKEQLGHFDFVYSWGVLHHTGDLRSALDAVRSLMLPGCNSRLALALYRRTRLDPAWIWEKRQYNRLGTTGKRAVEMCVGAAWDAMRLLKGISPRRYRAEYVGRRGMSHRTDLADWLGGYPYEPCSREELVAWARSRDLFLVREFVKFRNRVPVGIAGSGCDEFVFGYRE